MNKKALTISLVIAALVMGGIAYLLMSPEVKKAEEDMIAKSAITQQVDAVTTEKDSVATEAQATTNPAPGAYVNYTEDALSSATGTRLLFFHAPWCPQCRALETDIIAKGVPNAVSIIKVDYDTNQSLRKKYGVTLQTTVVRVDDNGGLVKKFVAYDDPSLQAIINNLL